VPSEEVALELSFEVLLGVLAVTTFLVGFSTVRLQATLQEWRERGERILNRLLEQNIGEDLLPLPTTLRTLASTSQKLRIDLVTWLTLFATIVSLGAYLLVSSELFDVASESEKTVIVWLNSLTSIIMLAGFVDVALVKYKSSKESRHTPSRIFGNLERSLREWSRAPEKMNYLRSGAIAKSCQEFELQIPDWCWITLIRYDITLYWESHRTTATTSGPWQRVPFSSNGTDVVLLPLWLVRLATLQFRAKALDVEMGLDRSFLMPAVQRMRALASKSKSEDAHSLIAWVWASCLLNDDRDDMFDEMPTIEDMERISRFRKGANDTFAELALRCAARYWKSSSEAATFRLTALINEIPTQQPMGWRTRVWERAVSPFRAVDLSQRDLR
jgi:hypothetical protein